MTKPWLSLVVGIVLVLNITSSGAEGGQGIGDTQRPRDAQVPLADISMEQQAPAAGDGVVKRFRLGAEGGVGLDPELIMFGGHGAFAPLDRFEVRPGVEFGLGEVTTTFGINVDVLYLFPGNPYIKYV